MIEHTVCSTLVHPEGSPGEQDPAHRGFVGQRWAVEVADFQEFDVTAW